MEERMTFKVLTAEGKELECEALFTFESDETKNNYMVYTDNTLDEQGNVKVYAAIYDKKENGINLIPIESEKEWKMVEAVLEEVQAEFSDKESNGQ